MPANASIAIACYNQGRFLGQAIRSCLEQTSRPREILVVDDGSSDDTREVAEGFPEVRYVHQPNAGLSAARNTGLALATTPRILFLDADDWLTPEALAAAMQAMDAAPSPLAFVYGSYQEVDESGAVAATHLARNREDAFRELLRGNHIAMHGTVLYNAAILRASGGFDTDLRSCEDYDVYLRLVRDHPIAAYPAVAACYRRHDETLSRDRFSMIGAVLKVLDRHGSGSPGDRAALREGRALMMDYYARQLVADLRRDRARAVRAMLASSIRRPRVAAQLLRWAIARSARAVTITG